jgi:hypothetical protein
MDRKITFLISLTMMVLAGCDFYKPAPSSPTISPQEHFSMTSSSDGTFLLDRNTGHIWRYTSDSKVFSAIPLVSEDTVLMRMPSGEVKEIPLSQVKDSLRRGASTEKDQGASVDDIVKALNKTSPKTDKK